MTAVSLLVNGVHVPVSQIESVEFLHAFASRRPVLALVKTRDKCGEITAKPEEVEALHQFWEQFSDWPAGRLSSPPAPGPGDVRLTDTLRACSFCATGWHLTNTGEWKPGTSLLMEEKKAVASLNGKPEPCERCRPKTPIEAGDEIETDPGPAVALAELKESPYLLVNPTPKCRICGGEAPTPHFCGQSWELPVCGHKLCREVAKDAEVAGLRDAPGEHQAAERLARTHAYLEAAHYIIRRLREEGFNLLAIYDAAPDDLPTDNPGPADEPRVV